MSLYPSATVWITVLQESPDAAACAGLHPTTCTHLVFPSITSLTWMYEILVACVTLMPAGAAAGFLDITAAAAGFFWMFTAASSRHAAFASMSNPGANSIAAGAEEAKAGALAGATAIAGGAEEAGANVIAAGAEEAEPGALAGATAIAGGAEEVGATAIAGGAEMAAAGAWAKSMQSVSVMESDRRFLSNLGKPSESTVTSLRRSCNCLFGALVSAIARGARRSSSNETEATKFSKSRPWLPDNLARHCRRRPAFFKRRR